MNKYQVEIQFEMDEEFMSLVPEHRNIINDLINEHVIEYYLVSISSLTSWILINAVSVEEVKEILSQSPLYKFWTLTVHELFIADSLEYRLPEISLN